ncbi:unnamed protein product [Protopolystoma xenopodis]|uniref:Uncharacterized protein n=1 Tax=Protopolystoma xenopodis TaxID=117903 RepID=A0A3S5ACP0_9PLAT|nr:unnamed protein product [Protopolystoma xenopodis]
MAKLTDDANYDAGETSGNVLSPRSDSGTLAPDKDCLHPFNISLPCGLTPISGDPRVPRDWQSILRLKQQDAIMMDGQQNSLLGCWYMACSACLPGSPCRWDEAVWINRDLVQLYESLKHYQMEQTAIGYELMVSDNITRLAGKQVCICF